MALIPPMFDGAKGMLDNLLALFDNLGMGSLPYLGVRIPSKLYVISSYIKGRRK